MGILSLITAAFQAFIEFSKDFKIVSAAIQKNNDLKLLELRSKALQDARDAMTDEEYKAAAKELHNALLSL